jgi:hypothetical protein
MDTWMGIVAVLIGLLTCFYGYPLFRILLILAGLIIGYAVGQTFVQASHPWLSLVLGVIAAIALAVLAYPLWSIGVTLSGVVLGFIILSALGAAFNASHGALILLGALGAVIMGVFFYSLRDLFVMLTTALNGAIEVAFGLGCLMPTLAFRRGAAYLPLIAIIIILGAIGFAVQYGMFKDRRTYSRVPEAGRFP